MAKFDFESSRYAKFFSSKENTRYLQDFINTEGVLFTNYGWYLTQGHKAEQATPVDNRGIATFTVKSRKLEAASLMDMRAPLADSNQEDQKGIEWYTASIPDFIAPGTVETAMERDYKQRLFEEFGNDADIVAAWTAKVQSKVDSADATMNYMTAQLMSTGKLDYSTIGRGIQTSIHKATIPEENFVTAGQEVWTSETCKLLTQMKRIEEKFRSDWGYTGALKWQVTHKMFHDVILKNAEVLEYMEEYRTANLLGGSVQIFSPTTMGATEDMFYKAIASYDGLSPIEIVVEKERNKTNTGDSFVHGWADNIAVLRPSGDACEFEHAEILDKMMFEKYGASTIDQVFATTNNGLGLLFNTTLNNGKYKEWHTDLALKACPALIEFPHHVIVDTATADE
jgi:hypothetical protein